MKIVKEMLSADGKYKSVVMQRDDGLYEVDWQYWIRGDRWISTSNSSLNHPTDSLDQAIKTGEEQLLTLLGKELDGMTVNERLVIKALEEEFDRAINVRDKERAVSILMKVRLTEGQAVQTVEAIFNNPKYYGY